MANSSKLYLPYSMLSKAALLNMGRHLSLEGLQAVVNHECIGIPGFEKFNFWSFPTNLTPNIWRSLYLAAGRPGGSAIRRTSGSGSG